VFQLLCKCVLVVAAAGVLSLDGARAAPPAGQTERAYQAQWIWCHVESPGPFQFVRFRKTVELASRPAGATAYVAADTFYRLWINGQLAMHGPARSSRGSATVDPVDVGRFLARGKNTLMIEVFHGVCPFEALAQAPGLLCELEADLGGKKTILAATDVTWEASEITAWSRESLKFNYQRGWVEQFDARRTLEEKMRPAIVLGKVGTAPWRKVEMRDVPLPAPLAEVHPASVVAVERGDGFAADFHGPETRIEPRAEWDKRSEWFRRLHTEHLKADPSAATNPKGLTKDGRDDAVLHGDGAGVSCDLGRGYVGFIGFEVTGKAGQVVEIAWNERLSADGRVRPCAQTGRNAIRFTLGEGRQSFLAFMPQFVRFLRIAHRGQGNLTAHKLWVTEFRFAAEPKGDFACSDDGVNRVYQAARWTAALNTLDSYMDCPHRERNAMYGVEGYWMQKAVYPMFGDTSVSRRAIGHGADSVSDPEGTAGPPDLVHIAYPMHLKFFNTVIPTQPLFWVLHAGLYERCSGDAEFIRAMLPLIRRNLAAMDGWRNSDGLLESIPSWMFFDYANIRTDGVSIALNGVYARTLAEAARLERLTGDASRADELERRARQVRSALNRLCPGDSFYPDVLVRDPQKMLVPSREACETTQYFAMWGGVPLEDRQRRMWQALRDDFLPTPLRKVQPIRGLTRAGLYPFLQRLEVAARLGDHAALLRDAKAMFLPMADSAPGTLWEDPMAGIALCHSIGCGVGGVLTEELLGIRLGFPLKITPHNGGSLTWCKGFVTTPKGRIDVDWQWQKDRYQLRASLPKGIAAEVILPPEAKAVWQSAPASSPWRDGLAVSADATIVVTPGSMKQSAGSSRPASSN
jgi:alpha-L-rhamnosidase